MVVQRYNTVFGKPRTAFLFLLAIGITLVFTWLIKGFLISLLVAAVLAGILHPIYRRMAERLGGRESMASAVTVLLSLVVLIIPSLLLLGILVAQAIDISDSAREWVISQTQESGTLQQQIEMDPTLKRLLPYQDQLMEKAGQLAGTAGTYVAQSTAAGVKVTVQFMLLLFVQLYAMFYFLIDGRATLDEALRFTPLSADDKDHLLKTFTSVGRATLKGTLVIGIVQGGLGGLAFWVAGIKGVLFWSAMMAVMSVLPGFGPTVVWVPAVIYLALNGQTGAAVGVGLWCAIVVGTIDNVLRPRLVGKDTEMPDLLVLLTTLGGLALFGISGLIIGPIIGALFTTVWRIWGSAIDEDRNAVAPAAAENIGDQT
jgi:predicted PurR-regulated permease PerM